MNSSESMNAYYRKNLSTYYIFLFLCRIDKYNHKHIGNIDGKKTERIFPARYIIYIYFSLFFTSVLLLMFSCRWWCCYFSSHLLAFRLTLNMCNVHYMWLFQIFLFLKLCALYSDSNIKVLILIIRRLPFHYFALYI